MNPHLTHPHPPLHFRKERVASSGSRVSGWAAFYRGDFRSYTPVLFICLHAVIHLFRDMLSRS
jgi:hypothetical protein